MILTMNSINTTIDEIEELDRTNPYNVVGAFIQAITEFNPEDPEPFFEKLQVLQGEMQPLTEGLKQNVQEKMNEHSKYEYIGKSYFIGAKPENEYEPLEPYQIEVTENPYSNMENDTLKLFVKSGGSDALRGVMVCHGKDRNYYILDNSFIGLLADIRQLDSEEAWT
ncbi:MAG: hypothetical protein J6X28_05885 [Bacilli bacterium]|nr:hypothetical protein [Bacilli bacterium]